MRVFRLEVDVSKFQTVVLMDQSLWSSGQLNLDGREVLDWVPPRVRVFNPLKERGNFFHFATGALVCDQQALDSMLDIFEMAGQVLPLQADDEELFLLNVTECVNALNAEASEWRMSRTREVRLGILRHSFYEGFVSESSVFKIPETVRAEVLAYSDVKNSDDEFLGRYRSSGLTGIKEVELFHSSAKPGHDR